MFQLFRKTQGYAALLLSAALLAHAAAPEGWLLAGSKPANYDTGLDPATLYLGRPSAFLKAKSDAEGFGTLMQQFSAARYLGKLVRFSAWVKSQDVARWSGLWMRIDGSPGSTLAFDNMQNRPIKGTGDWRKYEVVLDVKDNATGIFFGVLLNGPGEVWLSSAGFEVVGPEVPATDVPDGPRNLGLDK